MSSPSQRFAFLLSLMVGTWFFHPVQAGNVEIFDVTNGNNSGPGSLRAAVAEAESSTHQGDLFIRIDAAAVPAITLTTGPIEITDPRIVEISSNINLSRTVIDALQTSRLFVITAPDSELRFLRLVLQNGQTSVDAASTATCAPGTGRGGAICSLGAVEFQDSTLVDNRTLGNGAHGGAVFAAGWIELGGFCFSPGGCLYTGNSTEGDNAHGGALFSESLVLIDRSDNRLQNHRFSQNHLLGASSRGGAIHAPRVLVQPFSGTDNSANSDQEPVRFETNGADTGGAIFLDCASVDPNATSVLAQVGFISNVAQRAGGALAAINQCRVRIDRGRFELNQCFDFGGGAVFSDGELDLSYSLWSQNSCAGSGGAVLGHDVLLDDGNLLIGNFTTGAGNHGGAVAADFLRMRSTSVVDNRVSGRDSNGGGLWVTQSFDIGNSTLSGNMADDGDASRGGAVYYRGSGQDLVINSSTLTSNAGIDGGGAIFLAADPVGSPLALTVASTVLSGNGDDNLQTEGVGLGTVIDVVQSVFGDASTEISGTNAANIFTNTPELGLLADNGCRFEAGNWSLRVCPPTHAPAPMSLLIDSGDNPGGFESDQRGFTFPRTFGVASDIGAVEVNPDPSLSVAPSMLDFGTIIAGDIVSRSLTVSNDGPGVLFFEGVIESVSGTNLELGDCEDAVLLAGQSCEITIDTSPFPEGEINDTIEILSDDPQSPFVVPVRIFAVTGAELALDRTAIDFGDLPVVTPSPVETLVVENVGVRPLDIFDISVTGDGFALLGDDCGSELAPGAACAAEIQFTPGSVGVATGTLMIQTNSIVNSAETEVVLTGSSGVIFADGFEG